MAAKSRPQQWQWVVLFSTFGINLILEYYAYLFSIVKPAIEAEYLADEWSETFVRSIVSIMGAIIPSLCLILAPLGSALVYLIGCRRLAIAASVLPAVALVFGWLLNDIIVLTGAAKVTVDILTISLATGLACGALYGPSIASIQEYFAPNQRGFATGVVVCAGPASALIFGGVSYWLAQTYSWRGVFLLAAGLALNGIPAGLAYDHPDDMIDPSAPRISRKQLIARSFGFHLFREWHFNCVLASTALSITSYIAVLLLMSQASVPSLHVSELAQSLLLVIYGVSNLVGRFVCGVIVDHGHKHFMLTAFVIYLLGTFGCAFTIMIFATVGIKLADVGFIAFAFTYGLFIAPLTALRSVIMETLYSIESLNASFGWLLFWQGLVFLIGFPLTDWLNSLDILFSSLLTSGCLVLSGVFMLFIHRPYFAERAIRIQSMSALTAAVQQ